MKWKFSVSRLVAYIVIVTWLFSLLDWRLVDWKYNNRDHRSWLDRHEQLYSDVVVGFNILVCTPCVALKPFFYRSLVIVDAPFQEQMDLWHGPLTYMSDPVPASLWISQGRYSGLPYRSISIWAWLIYWLAPSIVWCIGLKKSAEVIREFSTKIHKLTYHLQRGVWEIWSRTIRAQAHDDCHDPNQPPQK
jgi:hypothetical protein